MAHQDRIPPYFDDTGDKLVRRAQYRGSHRTFFTIAIAVIIATCCVVVIAVILPSQKPRRVDVTEAAAINPLPTTIGFADADTYGMSQADVDKTASGG
jgi:polysaccharide biosynthesis protein PslG